jgi:hypothetical protein
MLLVTLLAAEVGGVVVLHRLGSRAPFAIPYRHVGEWLGNTAPADALAAVLRLVALVGCAWLLLTTTAYLAACVSRVPAAVRAAQWATLPAVRRVVEAGLAVSIAAGSVLAPSVARAATPPAAASPSPATAGTGVRDGHHGTLESLPAEPTSTTAPTTAPPPVAPTMAGPLTVVVEPGDNLWEVAARHLAVVSGRTRSGVSDAEIAPYWVLVCDANTSSLRSGDVNLIFPGETVTLPPVP